MKFEDIIRNDKVVVHCSTEEQANKLLNIANAYGLKWCNKDSYIGNNNFGSYGDKTCYYLSDGTYCDLDYFRYKHNFSIIEFDDLMLSGLNKEQTTKIIEMAKREGLSIDEFLNRVEEIFKPNC